MLQLVEYIKKNNLGEVLLDKYFCDITTLKIGGKINLLYYPNTISNFIVFYNYYLKQYNNKKLIIIGNGSNILASSDDFNGIVVCFKKIMYKYTLINNIVTVNSGVMIMDLINYLKENNLSGLEKLSYIPATIGGMIKMNAGAYNKEISENLLFIKCIDKQGNIKIIKKNEIIFKYRYCSLSDEYIILECTFILDYKDKKNIEQKIKLIKKERLTKQPLKEFNAGSTFKNINGYPIWKLIDSVGLRGYSINDASVSNLHSNFLINKNKATGEDMLLLINLIKDKVKEKFNLSLECEWILINFKKSVYFS